MSLRLLPVIGLLAAVSALPASADEASEKLKATAAANLKKADVTKFATVETDELIVCATLTEAKAKTLADQLQKAHALARKALQVEEKDNVWRGKLTVYYLPETKAYKNFVRTIAQTRPDESHFFSLQGDAPFVAESGEVGDKPTEAEQFAETAGHVAAALLVKKGGGASPPTWVSGGFGRAVSLRAEGTNSKRYATYKAAARRVVLGGAGRQPAPVSDAWAGRGKDGEVVATSLMEYVSFAPTSGAGAKFIAGFRPTEN
ncbi:MAG TPA: hypothetical protein VMZ71_15490, partial [Gemmataceae bacterium]|nr:hypothetical protein [Gemmataceae bacterium]